MAGERVKLVVSQRTLLGSAESRRLRRQGLIPGILYGRSEPVPIAVGERDLRAALTTEAGGHAVLELGAGQAAAVEPLFRGLEIRALAHDLSDTPRCLVLQKA